MISRIAKSTVWLLYGHFPEFPALIKLRLRGSLLGKFTKANEVSMDKGSVANRIEKSIHDVIIDTMRR